jgi:hypothetical protein
MFSFRILSLPSLGLRLPARWSCSTHVNAFTVGLGSVTTVYKYTDGFISLLFGTVIVRHVYENRLLASCLSVRPSAGNNSTPTGRIFIKSDI